MKELDRLLKIMADLRDPVTGCPWDQKQTLKTILPYTWEEIHELADAIFSSDTESIKDELGDLLFHIVYYSQITSEKNEFSFRDVVENINQKLARRHPYVSGDEVSSDNKEHFHSWEDIKASEREKKRKQSIFTG